MIKMRNKIFSQALLIYFTLGIVIINLTLFLIYSLTSQAFTGPDIIFIFKITGEELFPIWGVIFPFLNGFLFSFISFLSFKVEKLQYRLFLNVIAWSCSFFFSLFYLPLSVTIGSVYVILMSIMMILIIFRHKRFIYPRLVIADTSNLKKGALNERSVVEAVRQEHQVWLTIFRESITLIVAYIIAGGVSIIIPILSNYFPAFEESTVAMVLFSRLQIILILITLIYGALGALYWTTAYAYNNLIKTQTILNTFASETLENYKK